MSLQWYLKGFPGARASFNRASSKLKQRVFVKRICSGENNGILRGLTPFSWNN
jgi:hypothetical protein